MNTKIRVGDFVAVNFNNAQSTLVHSGEVISIRAGDQDPWIIKDNETFKLHYISELCTVTKSF